MLEKRKNVEKPDYVDQTVELPSDGSDTSGDKDIETKEVEQEKKWTGTVELDENRKLELLAPPPLSPMGKKKALPHGPDNPKKPRKSKKKEVEVEGVMEGDQSMDGEMIIVAPDDTPSTRKGKKRKTVGVSATIGLKGGEEGEEELEEKVDMNDMAEGSTPKKARKAPRASVGKGRGKKAGGGTANLGVTAVETA